MYLILHNCYSVFGIFILYYSVVCKCIVQKVSFLWSLLIEIQNFESIMCYACMVRGCTVQGVPVLFRGYQYCTGGPCAVQGVPYGTASTVQEVPVLSGGTCTVQEVPVLYRGCQYCTGGAGTVQGVPVLYRGYCTVLVN